MQFRSKLIAPPKNWEIFEDLCHALFKLVWQNPLVQKNGRKGQAQCGVDIFGYQKGNYESLWGVQCKGKDANYGSEVTKDELTVEIAKADNFTPPLNHWIYATTAPVDANIQETARELTLQRKNDGVFGVDVLGWDEIKALMASHPKIITEFYPNQAEHISEIVEELRTLSSINEKLSSVLDRLEVNVLPTAEPPTIGKWIELSFDSDRGLGPALLGRPMGPADAAACPRLQEITSLTYQLNIAYSARLIGEPGVGKVYLLLPSSTRLCGVRIPCVSFVRSTSNTSRATRPLRGEALVIHRQRTPDDSGLT